MYYPDAKTGYYVGYRIENMIYYIIYIYMGSI